MQFERLLSQVNNYLYKLGIISSLTVSQVILSTYPFTDNFKFFGLISIYWRVDVSDVLVFRSPRQLLIAWLDGNVSKEMKYNEECAHFRDSLVVSVGNCATSIFAGFVIFGIIGFMAHELGAEVKDVAKQGAYPSVILLISQIILRHDLFATVFKTKKIFVFSYHLRDLINPVRMFARPSVRTQFIFVRSDWNLAGW